MSSTPCALTVMLCTSSNAVSARLAGATGRSATFRETSGSTGSRTVRTAPVAVFTPTSDELIPIHTSLPSVTTGVVLPDRMASDRGIWYLAVFPVALSTWNSVSWRALSVKYHAPPWPSAARPETLP